MNHTDKWHEFEVGDELKWSFFGEELKLIVKGTAKNYVSVVYKDAPEGCHPFRLYESELNNLEKVENAA